jgi:DNA-directed RNA polymerase subunit RPC12/RpoP
MPRVVCPKCSARLKVDDDLDDDRIECTRCGRRFVPPQEEPVHRGKKVQKAGALATLGGCLVIFVLCGGGLYSCGVYNQRARDDLAAADRLYAKGKKAEAGAKYSDRYSYVTNDRRVEIIRRVADHEATAGDKGEARRWVEKGLNVGLEIDYETQAARELLAQVERERAAAEAARRQAEAAKRKADEEERQKGLPVTAEELRRESAADRKAADAKYKGKTLR